MSGWGKKVILSSLEYAEAAPVHADINRIVAPDKEPVSVALKEATHILGTPTQLLVTRA